MRKVKLIFLLCVIIIVQSCKNNSDSSNDSTADEVAEEEILDDYPDGTYCADIDYYNPQTGTRNTYTLNVEVESHEVTVIHWPNGGWLDSSHFSPEELDSTGSCSFSSYDGKQYDIQITGPECTYTDNVKVRNDQEDATCPECGGSKSEYDKVCYNCKRKKEDVEEHTCKRCGQYDSFMFSTDELCSDCEQDDKNKKREEEDNQ